MKEKLLNGGENIEAMGDYEQFLLLPQFFQKVFTSYVSIWVCSFSNIVKTGEVPDNEQYPVLPLCFQYLYFHL